MGGDYVASGGCIWSLFHLVESVNGIKTRCENPAPELKSPGPVARLMGLDLMVLEPKSPSLSSLTPRTRSVFADLLLIDPKRHSFDDISPLKRSPPEYCHRRFSLHVPRENASSPRLDTEVSRRRPRATPPSPDENISPMGVHVMRKVTERVGRRNALHDISNGNTISRTPTCQEIRRAPKVRKLQQSTKKSRKVSDYRFKNMKQEPFFESARSTATPEKNKCKKEAIVKRVPSTKLPKRQASNKKMYRDPEETSISIVPEDNSAAEYKRYIRRILKKAGFLKKGVLIPPFSTTKLLKDSHVLHSSFFYYLEMFHPITGGELRHRCNRKLIFQVVDEILAETLEEEPNTLIPEIQNHILESLLSETITAVMASAAV